MHHGGEVNCVRQPWERQGAGFLDYGSKERREFNQFIQDLGKEDVPLIGRKITWYKPNGKARSIID